MADTTHTQQFTRQEPLLLTMRACATLTEEPAPQSLFAVAVLPVAVPVPNRAGTWVGWRLDVSVEPGTVITGVTRVDWTLPGTDAAGVFWLAPAGCDGPLPPAQVTGADLLDEVTVRHLPQSRVLLAHEAGEFPQVRTWWVSTARTAEETLLGLWEPLRHQKLSRLHTRGVSSRVDEDALSEMLVTCWRGLRLFASPRRPNRALFNWLDRELWRAAQRAVKADTETGPVQVGLPDAWQEDAAEPLVSPVTDDLSVLLADLPPVEAAVVAARLEVVDGKRATWGQVADRLGLTVPAARWAHRKAVQRVEARVLAG